MIIYIVPFHSIIQDHVYLLGGMHYMLPLKMENAFNDEIY